jgi:uncharacterized protein YfeS
MDILDDDWELAEDTAHPNAARLLDERFYWDPGDELSPFGSTRGAEVLAYYRAALEADPALEGGEFLDELFEEWDVDRDFAAGIPDEQLAQRLEREHLHILAYDDAVIAAAFSQVVLLGEAAPEVAESAIRSLERQMLPEVLDFRGWSDPAERLERCEAMIAALRRAS